MDSIVWWLSKSFSLDICFGVWNESHFREEWFLIDFWLIFDYVIISISSN
jgi:hypothetical protein